MMHTRMRSGLETGRVEVGSRSVEHCKIRTSKENTRKPRLQKRIRGIQLLVRKRKFLDGAFFTTLLGHSRIPSCSMSWTRGRSWTRQRS